MCCHCLFFKQKTAYEMRISDWSSDVCSSDLISAQAQALTGTLKKIADSHSITVGIRQALLPFSYYDNNQQVIGYSADLCKYVLTAIQSKLGLDALNR